MAGPPQEPSWTPAGQEPTQARPGWPQQPSFTPPPPPQQDGYGYPQQQQPAQGGYAPPPPPPGYGGQEQAYAQEQPYAGQDQTYAGQDQAYGSQGQQYQAQAQPDPGPAAWQSVPGVTPGRPGGSRQKALGERGFFGSLFDFSFTSMVTPKIIKVLYVLYAIWTALLALVILVISFRTGGLAGGLFVLIVIEPIFILLMLGVSRVILEAFMVVFRIYEETVKIREHGEREL
jgi:Domain of unknown function (DUF4282)